jgi:hypothetical protein
MSSTSKSEEYTKDLERYKKQNPGLTEGDIKTYNINRGNYFAGTIAVCVIYGVFCLILLLLTVFSPVGSQLITDTFRTFTITFIIGMIIAVIILAVTVVGYQPTILHKNPYDSQMCPDYWELVPTNATDATYANATSTQKTLMSYQCKNTNKLGKGSESDGVITNRNINKGANGNVDVTGNTGTDPVDLQALYTYTSPNINTYSLDSKLDCNKVFPILLNSVNNANTSLNSNTSIFKYKSWYSPRFLMSKSSHTFLASK